LVRGRQQHQTRSAHHDMPREPAGPAQAARPNTGCSSAAVECRPTPLPPNARTHAHAHARTRAHARTFSVGSSFSGHSSVRSAFSGTSPYASRKRACCGLRSSCARRTRQRAGGKGHVAPHASPVFSASVQRPATNACAACTADAGACCDAAPSCLSQPLPPTHVSDQVAAVVQHARHILAHGEHFVEVIHGCCCCCCCWCCCCCCCCWCCGTGRGTPWPSGCC
jgi:hypothetical protein